MRWLFVACVFGAASGCYASHCRDDDAGRRVDAAIPSSCPARGPELRIIDTGILDLGGEVELLGANGDGRTVIVETHPGRRVWNVDVVAGTATPVERGSDPGAAPRGEVLMGISDGDRSDALELWELRGAVLTSLGAMTLPGVASPSFGAWDGSTVVVGTTIDGPYDLWIGPWRHGAAPGPWLRRDANGASAALGPDGLHLVLGNPSTTPESLPRHLVLGPDGAVTSEATLEDVGFTSAGSIAWLASSEAPLVVAGWTAAGATVRRFRADDRAAGGIDLGADLSGGFAFRSTVPAGIESGYAVVGVRDSFSMVFHAELDGRATPLVTIEGPCRTGTASMAAGPCGYALFCTFRGEVRTFLAVPAAR